MLHSCIQQLRFGLGAMRATHLVFGIQRAQNHRALNYLLIRRPNHLVLTDTWQVVL